MMRVASQILQTLFASYHLHYLCLLQWTAELNAAITQKFFAWLVGPLEVQEAEIEYKGEKKMWRSGVQIKKCRYLEQSGCKGMCINMCKVSPAHFEERKDYATYAVALYMGDKHVEHCPPSAETTRASFAHS